MLAPELTAAPSLLDDTNANIHLNFRGAPLEQVLTHLSEAAGFVIVLDQQRPGGTVDVISERPVTRRSAGCAECGRMEDWLCPGRQRESAHAAQQRQPDFL
jgi:hypothetical protein